MMTENKLILSEKAKDLMREVEVRSPIEWLQFKHIADKDSDFETNEKRIFSEICEYLKNWSKLNKKRYQPEIERCIKNEDEKKYFEVIMVSLIMLIFFLIWLNRR